jgi:hypothetical protein
MQDLDRQVFDQELALNLAAFFVFHLQVLPGFTSESDFGRRCNNGGAFVHRLQPFGREEMRR